MSEFKVYSVNAHRLWTGYNDGELSALEDCPLDYKRTEDNYVVKVVKLEQANEKIKDLEEKLEKAKDALKKVNQSELNSMRPGGGFSESARISYQALKEIRGN